MNEQKRRSNIVSLAESDSFGRPSLQRSLLSFESSTLLFARSKIEKFCYTFPDNPTVQCSQRENAKSVLPVFSSSYDILYSPYIRYFMLNETKQKEKKKKKKEKKNLGKSREGKEKWQGLNYAWYKFHEGKFADRNSYNGERERIRCLLKFKRTLTRLAMLFPSNFDGTMVMASAGRRKYDQAE